MLIWNYNHNKLVIGGFDDHFVFINALIDLSSGIVQCMDTVCGA